MKEGMLRIDFYKRGIYNSRYIGGEELENPRLEV